MRKVFAIAVGCALAPVGANAQIVITEVMYDLAEGSDSGREWVEVFNAGNAPVDLTTWRLFENGTNHKIAGGTLAPATYAVIADNPAKFKTDWPDFSGLLFDSAFSLSNEGETIVLRDGSGADINSVVFTSGMGGDGTGESLQRLASGVFEAGMPTPGAGVPVGGLQKLPPQQTQTKTKQEVSPSVPIEIIGDIKEEPQAAVAATAATAASSHPSLYWWFSPLFLALCGSIGVAWARHLKKDEWTIIEEVG